MGEGMITELLSLYLHVCVRANFCNLRKELCTQQDTFKQTASHEGQGLKNEKKV